MIELSGLTKRYGEKTAVDQLTFSVRPGIVTGFLGPNGAGKSTTMRMVLGLDNPTGGDVRIDGKHYADLRNPLRHIGALLDAKTMHGGRTAHNHLLCLAQSNGIPASRVGEVLETVGLSQVAKKRAKGFSLGMGQRLGIAGALLGDPEILMFDEPVNGLDPEGIHWIRNLMKSLASQGRTIFVSSHLMSEMALTADHLVVIGQGRLMADTSMADFIAQNSRSYVRLRSPQQEQLFDVLHQAGYKPVSAGDGTLEVDGTAAADIGELAARNQLVLHELSPQQASLEEAFMQLTAESVEYHAHDGSTPTAPGAPPDPRQQPPEQPRWGQNPQRGPDMAAAQVMQSEWTKIRSVQSTVWTLASALVVTVAFGALFSALSNNQFSNLNRSDQLTFDPTSVSFAGIVLGQLALIVFGVLVVSNEYSTGMIRMSLAAVPQRGTFYFSKLVVATVLAFVVSVVTSFLTYFLGQALLGGHRSHISDPGVLRAVIGAALYMTLITLFSMGVASLLRSPMLSLGILMPFFFLISNILGSVSATKKVGQYLPDQAGSKITQVVTSGSDAPYGPWAGLGIMALWVAAAVLAGFVLLKKRDA